MDSREFRNALGQFPTGICLITVNDKDLGALALTANSFASVSLEPALVLWSIQNNSDVFCQYTQCEYFGISMLAASHADYSNRYARRGGHAIDADDFDITDLGVPLLKEALVNFSCRLDALHLAGDHHVVLAEVISMSTREGAPLVFAKGSYAGLQSYA
tara:strand:- start:1174 stop:1650 length:477 start_codon:yes stop_codon:yes gene_type:complete